jgi:hypothetical protein
MAINAAVADANTIINAVSEFSDIKCDDENQWNNVYCSMAAENFRAGESVEVDPPIQIDNTNYSASVGAILRVNQHSNPPRVLLSLFLNVTADMGIRHEPPDYQDYVQYPPSQLVWTRYQGWYPVTMIQREAFVLCPWEINNGNKDSQVSYGMSNAYCVVSKWNHEVLNPKRAFELLGHKKQNIPGCLHLINFESVSRRSWCFRSSVALKIAEVLNRPSLQARIQESVHLSATSESHWDNFKMRTIPDEITERNGIITKRVIRKNLVTETLKNNTINHFARFDTEERFALLMSYFGSGIQAAGQIRRKKGPKFSRRTGPFPAINVHRILKSDSVGAVIDLPPEAIVKYYSDQPGLDLLFTPSKNLLTVRIRYRIFKVTHPVVREQFLGIPPPLPAAANNDGPDGDSADSDDSDDDVVPGTEFALDDTVYVVVDLTVDDDQVVCEIVETGDDALKVGDQVNLPMDQVRQALAEYNC